MSVICREITVSSNERVDRAIKRHFPHLPGKEIDFLFEHRRVKNKQTIVKRGGWKFLELTKINLFLSQAQIKGKVEKSSVSQAKLEIMYEDNELLLVNKPANTHTVPHMYVETETLANLVASQFDFPSEFGLNYGAINRLDYETSGLVMFAKSKIILDYFRKKISSKNRSHEIEKGYLALIPQCSAICPFEELSDELDEGVALSSYTVLGEYAGFLLLFVELKTGYRHQIRKQLSERKMPIVGDQLYGSDIEMNLKLHAYTLSFQHPSGEKKIMIAREPAKDFWKME